MNAIAGIIGSGVGIIVLVVTYLLLSHVGHAPSASHPWIYRGLAILAYGGGSLLALTGVGALWLSIVGWFAGMAGGLSSGLGHTVIVIGSVILILGLIVGMWKAPNAALVSAAMLAPFVLMLTTTGFIHSFWVGTSQPAQQAAAQFAAWLGG